MGTRLSDRQMDEVCELYASGKAMQTIGDRFGVSSTTILRVLRRRRVKTRRPGHPRGVKDGQVESIIESYAQGLTCRKIAAKFGVSESSIWNYLRRNGVKCRKRRGYSLNEAAFDRAENSELASYYVGLLLADGCVSWRGKSSCQINLSLKEADSATVDGFRQFMGSSHPLRFHKRDGNMGPYYGCDLSFRSIRVADALSKYGVVSRKSGRATVAACMVHSRHFWRGYVDGNGSVIISRVGRAAICLSGSKHVCQSFVDFAKTLTFTKAAAYKVKGSHYQTTFARRKATVIVKELYGNCQVAMQRKLDVANKIISIGQAKGWLGHS